MTTAYKRYNPNDIKLSKWLAQAQAEIEGCVLYAYDDADSSDPKKKLMPGDTCVGTPTNGIGNTHNVELGVDITMDQAIADHLRNLEEARRIAVAGLDITKVTVPQFYALVDFAYQKGPGKDGVKDGLLRIAATGKPSTLLKKAKAQDPNTSYAFLSWLNEPEHMRLGCHRRNLFQALLYDGFTLSFDRICELVKTAPQPLNQRWKDLDRLKTYAARLPSFEADGETVIEVKKPVATKPNSVPVTPVKKPPSIHTEPIDIDDGIDPANGTKRLEESDRGKGFAAKVTGMFTGGFGAIPSILGVMSDGFISAIKPFMGYILAYSAIMITIGILLYLFGDQLLKKGRAEASQYTR